MALVDENIEKALKKILRYLSFRDRSEKEIRDKLKEFFDEDTSERALKEALRRGWVKADKIFLEDFLKRCHEKNRGYLWICREAQKKGLPSPELEPEEEKRKASEILVRKTFKNELQKRSHLAYRGFTQDVISYALENEELRD